MSNKLSSEIALWKVVEVPQLLYHGCRSDDVGIDINKKVISGNKWFSNKKVNVVTYATNFHTRSHTGGEPFILEVHPKRTLYAVMRPSKFDEDDNWVDFLGQCFPNKYGYHLSLEFQSTLGPLLLNLFDDSIQAYLSFDGEEVCIPQCENHIVIQNCIKLTV